MGALNTLPAAIAYFTDRTAEFAAIDTAVAAARDKASPAVVVLAGTPGVGRRTAALRWAHDNAGSFPDGSLYVDFDGPAGRAVTSATDLLASLLRQLGVPEEDLSASGADLESVWRARTFNSKLLVVLANVQVHAQIEAVMPSSDKAVVLVTTDHDLDSVIDAYGATRLRVGPLDEASCRELLDRMVGAERVAGDPEAVRALLELSEGWPDELCLAAGWLRKRSGREITAAVRRLRAARDADGAGPEGPRIVAVSDGAYEALPERARRAFLLLGLHPAAGDRPGRAAASGASFALPAAAALLGASADETEDDLETLLDWQLLTEENGRYRLHDRVRRHAVRKAGDIPQDLRDRAVRRVVESYLAMAWVADVTINPYRPRLVAVGADGPSAFGGGAQGRNRAVRWLEIEHLNLCACARTAAERGWHGLVVQLCDAQWALQLATRPYGSLLPVLETGMRAARELGDDRWIFQIACRLGRAYFETADFPKAHAVLAEGLAAARATGRREDEATAEEFSGRAYLDAGEFGEALPFFQRAKNLEERSTDPRRRARGTAIQSHHIARARLGLGERAAAIDAAEAAHRLFGEIPRKDGSGTEPDRYNQGRALTTLGQARLADGDVSGARAALLEALEIMRGEGRAYQEAQILEKLAETGTEDRRGHLEQAVEAYARINSVRAEQVRERITREIG
ncbi:hypothetical protein [Actinomadura atramentaria]|uniref:hypothetical protein n=1 Tax=Actinomadura atramentaria TaxID=1990 RepID=UPI00035EEC31|nr:hypothetical protein [Actinomadura atramentaria]